MGLRVVRLAAALAALGCLTAPSAAAAAFSDPATSPARAGAHIVFRIDVDEITESSALVLSTTHDGLVYTVNDSGDGPRVYVLDERGALVGTTTLSDVQAVDFEALAIGDDGSLVIGDIGDNDADRSSVALYKITQPARGDHTVKPDTVTLTYADGAHNAESLLYDARKDTAYVVTKELLAHVYESPARVFSRSTATLKRGAPVSSYATDAAWLPQDDSVVIRGYTKARVYRFPSWRFVKEFLLPVEKQGESIASVPGRRGVVWAGSEGTDSPVWEVPLPELPSLPGTAEATPTPAPAPATAPMNDPGAGEAHGAAVTDGNGGAALPVLGGAAACAVVVGAGCTLLASRRSRRSAVKRSG